MHNHTPHDQMCGTHLASNRQADGLAYTIASITHVETFTAAQTDAHDQGRGLWGVELR